MDPLPTPRNQGYEAARVTLKYQYGAIQLTGQVMALARTNRQAFANSTDLEMEGLREGLAKDQNRQIYGSTVGTLATATANGSTTTFVAVASSTGNNPGVQYLEVGMYVDLYDGTTLQDANVEITNIVESTGTVTLDPAVTSTTTGMTLVRNGSRTKETTGFDSIMDISGGGDSTLYNITHPTWTANLDNLAGALTEGAMIAMTNLIRRRGGNTTVIFTTEGVRTAYFNLLSQQRRITDTQDFAGGFKGLSFTAGAHEIPVVADWDVQPGRMYFINEKELKFYREGDWSWMNRDGSMWYRVQDSNGRYDAYGADLYMYGELGTHRRNSHGVIYGITEVL
jgi:hypothetical protein